MPIETFVYREKRRYMRSRRLLNAIVALIALVLAAPVLLVAAIAIVLEDGFPVFFIQRRVGRFERTFSMYKLRTMKQGDCIDGVSPSDRDDPRITRVGRYLRKLSIDELPQLLNVLRGEMSLVGPRPEMPFIVNGYANWQHLRHVVEPGITGLWQITFRSRVPLARPEATLLDLEYVRSVSAATDGILLAKTFKAVWSTRGAI